MNKDQKNGAVENLKGRVKQAVGIVTGSKGKEAEGAAERAGGAIKKAVGDLRHGVATKSNK
jgi:uncharacterized protein YjbJ (UPF0337 family)